MDKPLKHQGFDLNLLTNPLKQIAEQANCNKNMDNTSREVNIPKRLVRVIPIARDPSALENGKTKDSTKSEPKPAPEVLETKLHSTIVTHTGKEFHLCTMCNKAFPTKEDLGDHLEETHGGHICAVCKDVFKSEGLLKEHQLTHCGMDPPSCFVCDKIFKTLQGLKTHLANATHLPKLPKEKQCWQKECDVCGKTIFTKHHFGIHMRKHRGEFPYKCDTCGKAYADKRRLVDHIKAHNGVKPHQCTVCGKAFDTKSHLQQHMLVHEETKAHQCSICGKTSRFIHDFRKHLWLHSEQKPYQCIVCNKGFTVKTYLKTHLTKSHPEHKITESDLVQRLTLNDVFGTDKNSKVKPVEHHRDHHTGYKTTENEPNVEDYRLDIPNNSSSKLENREAPETITIIVTQSNTEVDINQQVDLQDEDRGSADLESEETIVPPTFLEKEATTTYPGNKVNQRESVENKSAGSNLKEKEDIKISSSKNSLKTHTGMEFHICILCKKAFTTEILLAEHLVSIHCKGNKFKCVFCAKEFPLKEALRGHMIIHTGKNLCTTCGRTFRVKAHLLDHIRIHTGEKPYQYPTCNKSFGRKTLLARHLRNHSDEKPYQCTLCGKTFKQKTNLNLHSKTHKSRFVERSYKCSYCDKVFPRKEHLKEHVVQHTDQE